MQRDVPGEPRKTPEYQQFEKCSYRMERLAFRNCHSVTEVMTMIIIMEQLR
jgi:hypothetical protein